MQKCPIGCVCTLGGANSTNCLSPDWRHQCKIEVVMLCYLLCTQRKSIRTEPIFEKTESSAVLHEGSERFVYI